MRILIAEDERDLNELIKKRLKNNGYSVDACFNGKEVFDYLLCAEYDALILDIMMPKMDGISVLRELRKEGNAVPVLLLTAKDSIEDRVTDKTTPRLIQFHTLKNAVNPPFLGGFSIFNTVVA